ncbi:hypothetical protein [Amycolatopsis sp.]|uniref:hypothetical protein n=1 Tax=Amycolatopsis sp. TaxID=37632 RepID=UPI002D805A3F|nr:hypothetical protein [Amycolatopsis sp.]HET6707137.1 hypothetical protein [Amycolatopsis sp.]
MRPDLALRRRRTPCRVTPAPVVGGRGHGSCSLSGGELRLTPFRPLPAAERTALEDEARRLLPFVGGESVSFERR